MRPAATRPPKAAGAQLLRRFDSSRLSRSNIQGFRPMVSASNRDRAFEEVGSSSPPSLSPEAIGTGLSNAVSTSAQSDSETALPPNLRQQLSRSLAWATCPNVDSSSAHVKTTRPSKKARSHSSSISPNGTKSRSKASRTTTAAKPTTTGFCRAKVKSRTGPRQCLV